MGKSFNSRNPSPLWVPYASGQQSQWSIPIKEDVRFGRSHCLLGNRQNQGIAEQIPRLAQFIQSIGNIVATCVRRQMAQHSCRM